MKSHSFTNTYHADFIVMADSPKRQNKSNSSGTKYVRNINPNKRTILSKSKAKSVAHDIVVVREATKKSGIDLDPDIQRLQVRNEKKTLQKVCLR